MIFSLVDYVTPSDEELKGRVAKGVALLDTKQPGWRERINTDRLRTADGWDCILGQLYEGYGNGCEALFGQHDELEYMSIYYPAEYGFCRGQNESAATYEGLDEVWRQEVSREQ